MMTDELKALADLLAKAPNEVWQIDHDPYGDDFPAICAGDAPWEFASFTAGECADANV